MGARLNQHLREPATCKPQTGKEERLPEANRVESARTRRRYGAQRVFQGQDWAVRIQL